MCVLNIAGLDCYVEGDILKLPFFWNYHDFLVEKESSRNCTFCLTYNDLAPIDGDLIADYVNESGEYRIYLSEEAYDAECFVPGLQRRYRMRANKWWYSIQVDMALVDEYDYGVFNDFLMIAFTYSSAFRGRVLLHASCINYQGEGVAFIGASGVGKSTQAGLWIKNIPGCSLLNDDQPALGLLEGVPYLFGTPWSGKTPCYKNERVKVNAFFLMKQAKHNLIKQVTPISLFKYLLGSCSMMRADARTLFEITQVLASVVDKVKGAWLENRPEYEAVEMAYQYSYKRGL